MMIIGRTWIKMKDPYDYFFREFHDQYGCKICIKDGIEFNTHASDHTDDDEIIHLMNEHGIESFGINQSKKSIEKHDKNEMLKSRKRMMKNDGIKDTFEEDCLRN